MAGSGLSAGGDDRHPLRTFRACNHVTRAISASITTRLRSLRPRAPCRSQQPYRTDRRPGSLPVCRRGAGRARAALRHRPVLASELSCRAEVGGYSFGRAATGASRRPELCPVRGTSWLGGGARKVKAARWYSTVGGLDGTGTDLDRRAACRLRSSNPLAIALCFSGNVSTAREGITMTAPQSPRVSPIHGYSCVRALRRGVLVLATAVGAVAVMAGSALSANTGSATLSNGAQLAVSIDSPPTGTEYVGTSVTCRSRHGQHRAWRSGRHDHLRDGLLWQYGQPGRGVRHDPRLREDVLRGAQRGGGRGRVDRRGRRREVRQRLLARTRLTHPTSAAVNTAINSGGPGSGTSCAAGLSEALTQVNATTNGTKIVVFASDGLCNAGANVSGPAGDLATAGAIVQSITIGAGSSCSTDGGREP